MKHVHKCIQRVGLCVVKGIHRCACGAQQRPNMQWVDVDDIPLERPEVFAARKMFGESSRKKKRDRRKRYSALPPTPADEQLQAALRARGRQWGDENVSRRQNVGASYVGAAYKWGGQWPDDDIDPRRAAHWPVGVIISEGRR